MSICIDDLLGVPYKLNGRTKNGFDCYGLLIEVEKRFNHILPDFVNASEENFLECLKMAVDVLPLKSIEEPTKEGDIILIVNVYGIPFHIGAYLGNGMFIHCNKYGVHLEKINMYKNRIGRVYTWQE